jgi:hypothetical protein
LSSGLTGQEENFQLVLLMWPPQLGQLTPESYKFMGIRSLGIKLGVEMLYIAVFELGNFYLGSQNQIGS